MYSHLAGSLIEVNANVPEIRISQSAFETQPSSGDGQPAAKAAAGRQASPIREFLLARGNSAIADRGFHWLMVLCALSIFAIVVLIATELVMRLASGVEPVRVRFFLQGFHRS